MSITGTRLKDLRIKRDVSQADVAKAIGISRTAYVKYETGASKPVRKLHELAKYFNVSADYLLGNDGTKAEPPLSKKQTILLKGFDSRGSGVIRGCFYVGTKQGKISVENSC